MLNKKILTTVLASIGASLCCITPILAFLAGSSSFASTFSWMEPFRPYLFALTLLVLCYAWFDKLKSKQEDIHCVCDEKSSFYHGKTFLSFISIFIIGMLSFPYWGHLLLQDSKTKTVYIQASNIKNETIKVQGMTCLGCEVSLQKSISKLKGIATVKASSAKANVIVKYDKTTTNKKEIIEAINNSGYKAKD